MIGSANGYYAQDLVRPAAIYHGFDFGDLRSDGTFGHAYNFLDYVFEEDGVELFARAYLDQPGKVSFRSRLELLRSDFGMRALMFLLARYERIEVLGEDGYSSLPDDLADAVAARLLAHMQTFA